MTNSALPVFRICLYTYLFNLLTSILALPTLSNSGGDSGIGSGSGSQRGYFTSRILINGDDGNNGTVISMLVQPHAFTFTSLPPVQDSLNIYHHKYWVKGTPSESRVTSSPSALSNTDGEENNDANATEVSDEEGMLITNAELLSGPTGVRCFLFYPYMSFKSIPRPVSEAMPSNEVETELEPEFGSEETPSFRFTSPIFTPESPLTYTQSPLLPPSSTFPTTRQPLSDPTSERASALICYLHPYPSPSSYPFNYPTRPTVMPIVVLLLEYTNPDTEEAINTLSLDPGQDADFQEERTGGLDLLRLDLYWNGSARYAFTEDITRPLGRVRGIRRAVVLEQGESTAENEGKKVVCRLLKGNGVAENRNTGLLWENLDAENEDDDWDSNANTSESEWEWDVDEDAEEGNEYISSLASFSLNEALQTTVHGVGAVACAYE